MTERDIATENRELAYRLSNNLGRLLREFGKDYENRVHALLNTRGHPDIRPSHSTVFANLGTGAVRVTELARRAQVTQQAMGKMLKELERLGYVARDVDSTDKRAREIRLTRKGVQLAADCLEVVDEVRQYYDGKVGATELAELEDVLRATVRTLQLDYLPESWVDAQP